MSGLLAAYQLSPADWTAAVLASMMIGASKTGFAGIGMLIVVLMASVFGGRASVGIVLPLLCVGDLFAIAWYNRHADWRHVRRLMPWAVAGILAALAVGASLPERRFGQLLAAVVLGGVSVMVWREVRGGEPRLPRGRWFPALMGLAGGFTTMIGNAAGPVMSLYLLSMRLPRDTFIGTAAWFFLIVNYLKLPLHAFVWGTITARSLAFDALMLPAVAAGAWAGYTLVRRIPERAYRWFIIGATTLAAVRILG